MMLIRRFEERAGEMYAKAKVGGFLHLAIGEEATIVGSARAMRDDDYLISTYRSHGHALARGTEPQRRHGRAVRPRRRRARRAAAARCTCSTSSGASWAATGSSAATCRSRAGFGLASDYLGTDDATLCTFGDGASNQGTFGETMNLAALWKLPVVFMVTNNQFGMGTALERHSAVTDLQRKGEGFGVPGMRCDGMDVLDTSRGHAARRCASPARSAGRCSSRRSRTASAATRWPTPRSTAPRSRSRSGASATRSCSFGDRLVAEGDRRAPTSARSSTRTRSRASTRRSRSPTRRRFPAPESLYDDVYVLGDQVRGWYSVDERSAGVHRARTSASSPSSTELDSDGRSSDDGRRPAADDGGRRGRRGHRAWPPPHSPAVTGTRVMRYREALNEALREEMQRDENVLLMGEDIGVFNGAFKVTDGLLEEFGEKRVRDTPISENTIVGMGVGAAMTGLRPVVELMTINFSLLAFDQIVNHAAHIRYMFGGQVRVPLVVRMPQGAGHQLGPTHSHCFEALFLHVPGLLVAVPSTPADAKGLLKAAIRDDNPVIFIEHEYLYGQRGEVPEDERPRRPFRPRGDPPRGLRRDASSASRAWP